MLTPGGYSFSRPDSRFVSGSVTLKLSAILQARGLVLDNSGRGPQMCRDGVSQNVKATVKCGSDYPLGIPKTLFSNTVATISVVDQTPNTTGYRSSLSRSENSCLEMFLFPEKLKLCLQVWIRNTSRQAVVRSSIKPNSIPSMVIHDSTTFTQPRSVLSLAEL